MKDLAVVLIWLSPMKQPNDEVKNGKCVGHVALELLEYDRRTKKHTRGSYENNTYVSIGPAEGIDILKDATKSVKMEVDNTYNNEDYGMPDLLFCFHGLEVDVMKEHVQSYKDNELDYKLFTSVPIEYSFFGRLYRKFFAKALPIQKGSHNCTSIVFALLHKGGFTSKLLSTSEVDEVNSIASLDASKGSSDAIVQKSLQNILYNTGYFLEAAGTSVVISPDIFAEYLKVAKTNQLKMDGERSYNDIVKPIYGIDEWRP